jgi:hypothetical protein
MNSFVNTVRRRTNRKDVGSDAQQGQGQGERVYSGAEESVVDGSTDSGKKKLKDKKKVKGVMAVSAEQALAAMQRATSAPFIADVSVIGGPSDQTQKLEDRDSDCELVMEEFPPPVPSKSVRVGHRGWVVGGEGEQEESQEGTGAGSDGVVEAHRPGSRESLQSQASSAEGKKSSGLSSKVAGKTAGTGKPPEVVKWSQLERATKNDEETRRKLDQLFDLSGDEREEIKDGKGEGGSKPVADTGAPAVAKVVGGSMEGGQWSWRGWRWFRSSCKASQCRG